MCFSQKTQPYYRKGFLIFSEIHPPMGNLVYLGVKTFQLIVIHGKHCADHNKETKFTYYYLKSLRRDSRKR